MEATRNDPDPISVEAFTAAGAPFELVETVVRGVRCRTFRNAPCSLGELYRSARVQDDKVCAVMEGARLTYGELFAQAACLAVHLRFAFTQQRADHDGPRAGGARAIIRDICRQLDQDKVVWDRQRHVPQPLLCDGDGPIPAFRTFFSQFYAELHRKSGPKMVRAQRMQRKAGV